jgi:hypothetical protein
LGGLIIKLKTFILGHVADVLEQFFFCWMQCITLDIDDDMMIFSFDYMEMNG